MSSGDIAMLVWLHYVILSSAVFPRWRDYEYNAQTEQDSS